MTQSIARQSGARKRFSPYRTMSTEIPMFDFPGSKHNKHKIDGPMTSRRHDKTRYTNYYCIEDAFRVQSGTTCVPDSQPPTPQRTLVHDSRH